MFDLEKSIADWREQMLAAGIKTPVPSEELENHLREEIEQQIQIGVAEQQAFEMATAQIGQAQQLGEEFKKASDFPARLDEDKNSRINHLLAVFWLEYCIWGFFSLVTPLLSSISGMIQGFRITPDFFLTLLFGVIFLRGMVASIRLFDGKNKEIRMIRFIAVLGLAAFVANLISFRNFTNYDISWLAPAVFVARTIAFASNFPLAVAFATFSMTSIWLLRPTQTPKLKAA
jgi:hypothetical protein